VLLAVLAICYGAFLERRIAPSRSSGLDPVSPRARQVERAIAAKHFADALPIALELAASYPGEALPAYWLALAYEGLGRFQDEAAAWERFIAVGGAPEEACPGLALAYARASDGGAGLAAYERCVTLDARDPERLVDLAAALERAGRPSDALEAYRRAAALDSRHPIVARHVERLARELEGKP
jgi:tetratricopeptide (TPR) repeat protein